MSTDKEKATYVNQMFDAIAARYDLMNRLMTAGRDRVWRETTAKKALRHSGGRLLDVAAGTADLSLALATQWPDATVFALDFSAPMLALGRAKAGRHPAGKRIHFLAGDALQLPCADASFDGVVSGFLMRNVTDIDRVFTEMVRVVRPGGKVVCLELTKPQHPLFRRFFWWYFTCFVPALGRWISRHPEAYAYLPQSLASFQSADELKAHMEGAGLMDVSFQKMMLGTVAIHWGIRPPA